VHYYIKNPRAATASYTPITDDTSKQVCSRAENDKSCFIYVIVRKRRHVNVRTIELRGNVVRAMHRSTRFARRSRRIFFARRSLPRGRRPVSGSYIFIGPTAGFSSVKVRDAPPPTGPYTRACVSNELRNDSARRHMCTYVRVYTRECLPNKLRSRAALGDVGELLDFGNRVTRSAPAPTAADGLARNVYYLSVRTRFN